jgi:hypothetical protein
MSDLTRLDAFLAVFDSFPELCEANPEINGAFNDAVAALVHLGRAPGTATAYIWGATDRRLRETIGTVTGRPVPQDGIAHDAIVAWVREAAVIRLAALN